MKAGDLLPNGMIYLGRIDDDVWMVNDKDADGLFTHQDALKHVDKLGMQLLDKTAGMLAYEKRNDGLLRGTFRTDKPYWLSELYRDANAWAQWFGDGPQYYNGRHYAFPVRPARRLTIQEFNDLVNKKGASEYKVRLVETNSCDSVKEWANSGPVILKIDNDGNESQVQTLQSEIDILREIRDLLKGKQ